MDELIAKSFHGLEDKYNFSMMKNEKEPAIHKK